MRNPENRQPSRHRPANNGWERMGAHVIAVRDAGAAARGRRRRAAYSICHGYSTVSDRRRLSSGMLGCCIGCSGWEDGDLGGWANPAPHSPLCHHHAGGRLLARGCASSRRCATILCRCASGGRGPGQQPLPRGLVGALRCMLRGVPLSRHVGRLGRDPSAGRARRVHEIVCWSILCISAPSASAGGGCARHLRNDLCSVGSAHRAALACSVNLP